jgi:hypothetical protein
MRNRGTYFKQATSMFIALSCVVVSSMGGADNVLEKRKPSIADEELFFAPVPKAVCGPGDKPETALQGQVPKILREQGFQGFSCNLQLLAQVKGEATSAAYALERAVRRIVAARAGDAALSGPGRANFGVRAIDISDPTKPYTTAYLQTSAMLDPWESLK